MDSYERRGGFGRRPSFSGSGTAPVKVGDELDVTIEAVGAKGDGIAKKDGFILFVPGVKQGDKVRIRVSKVLAKVGFADVVGAKQSGGSETTSEDAVTEEEPSVTPAEPAAEDSESFGEEAEATTEDLEEEA